MEKREEGKRGRKGGTVARVTEVGMLILLPVLLHFLVPIARILGPPYTYLGIPLLAGGLMLMNWAARTFKRENAGFSLGEQRLTLVTSGPFRFTRNPMYLGMLVWLTGLAVLLGSLVTFVFPALLFILANGILIPVEESSLEQTFGQQFVTYRRRVRRWL